MIAACLLTCGPERGGETIRTAESFARLNAGRDDLVRYHVDGGGEGRDRNIEIAREYGFVTLHAPDRREGQIESFRAFLDTTLRRGADFMLWLENDWESVAPIPPISFFNPLVYVDQFRLFGTRKMQGNGPRALAGPHRIGTKTLIDWADHPDFPAWEMARCHWGAGGTIVRPEELEPFKDRPRMKDIIVAANDLRSMRVKENILWHIGETTTGGFFG
jgi:hypothetical protein